MKKTYNIPDYVINLAKELRQKHTNSEVILWELLRNRRFSGFKFRRQQPIGRYITDFLCVEKKLVIEVDGGIHENRKEYDKEKDEYLKSLNYIVLRIPNKFVEYNIEEVAELINKMLL